VASGRDAQPALFMSLSFPLHHFSSFLLPPRALSPLHLCSSIAQIRSPSVQIRASQGRIRVVVTPLGPCCRNQHWEHQEVGLQHRISCATPRFGRFCWKSLPRGRPPWRRFGVDAGGGGRGRDAQLALFMYLVTPRVSKPHD
jgi:hypothetical protein